MITTRSTYDECLKLIMDSKVENRRLTDDEAAVILDAVYIGKSPTTNHDGKCAACYTAHACMTEGSECICESAVCRSRRQAFMESIGRR